MTKERYLDMMHQMGSKPKPEEIPPDSTDFRFDTLIVFEIYENLRDMWDTMGGGYLGKDLSTLPMLFDIYSIKEKSTKLLYLKLLNIMVAENIKLIANKVKMESKIKKK